MCARFKEIARTLEALHLPEQTTGINNDPLV